MVGDVLVEVFDEVSVSVDVQRFEIPHYVVKQAILGEELRDSRAAKILGAPVALDAVYQEFPLSAHQYASSGRMVGSRVEPIAEVECPIRLYDSRFSDLNIATVVYCHARFSICSIV